MKHQRGNEMKRLSLAICLLLLAAFPVAAQSLLSIVDVLSPFDLTATILANGHFSITTKYTGEPKTLIYQEDGSGGRPVNYTSHVHFKVDDVIFQLPYELNPVTRQSPPDHPLTVTQIYRDTVARIPRVNATMYGVMPDGDTIRFKLWLEPVKRPSGAFIRISAEVANTTRRSRDIGVLLLVDTKIGDNDRAPIISAFGYKTIETEFDRLALPGMPPFWLALEGTPIRPGLTARGNLTADGLLAPDYFLFGNWKDNTAVGSIGLALAQWNERRADNSGYTDSSVLLLWLQEAMGVGERRTRASTEIGLVDSLVVTQSGGIALGGGGLGGGGGGGGGFGGGCLAFDTVAQGDCDDTTFHPYAPDSLQALFLVTNETAPLMSSAEIRVENLPAGLTVASGAGPVIPSTLSAGVTGVATLTFFAKPRLYDTAYKVPVTIRANGGVALLFDTICIMVPGLPSKIDVAPEPFLPLCPGLSDTIAIPVELEGALCLDMAPAPEIIGAPADLAQFELVPSQPLKLPANGAIALPLRYTATVAGQSHQAKLVVHATMRGLNRFDRDTAIVISDTIDIRGEGRDAEFQFATPLDTLDFGSICVGDTAVREWTITNIGGCDLTIDNTYRFDNDPFNQFSVANSIDFPMTIERKLDGTALVRFSPTQAGAAVGRFIITSAAIPFVDTLIVKGFGDTPRYIALADTTIDTICPDRTWRMAVRLDNPTGCDVPVDSLFSADAGFRFDSPSGFIIPAKSGRTAFVSGTFSTPGTYTTRLNLRSLSAGDTTVDVRVVVASRDLQYVNSLDLGDIRVGSTGSISPITIRATGTAGVDITGLRLAGVDAAEYGVTFLNGATLPRWLAPGDSIEVRIDLTPRAIDLRRGTLIVESTAKSTCDAHDLIMLQGRGVLPIIDAPRRRYDVDRICAGSGIDTTIILRNFGNAPLTVSSVEQRVSSGQAKIDLSGLPVTIPPDSTTPVRARITPEFLGPFSFDLHFISDGEPFTPGDTLIRIEGAGILCGSISLDTVRATVGDVIDIPVRLDASPLTDADVMRLMNTSNSRSVSLSIGHDSTLLRFRSEGPTAGMLSGLTMPATVVGRGSIATLTTTNANGDVGTGMTLATLRADVLLGRTDRSILTLRLDDFADGWSRIDTWNGLLIAEYCAIDRRYVMLSKPFIRPSETPLKTTSSLQCWLPGRGVAVVQIVDMAGRIVATLHDGELDAGLHQIPLPPGLLTSGIYIATLRILGYVESARVVVER